MSYQQKLLATYSMLISALVLIFGIGFYLYSSDSYIKRAAQDLRILAERMSNQLDTIIQPMEFISMNTLSNGDFLNALSLLNELDRADPKSAGYINDAKQVIIKQLYNYSLDKNFHRVSTFNRKGDFFTCYFSRTTNGIFARSVINQLSWLDAADSRRGRFALIPPYLDPWVTNSPELVFGLVRSVQFPTPGIGYVEIQNPVSDLDKIFLSLPDQEQQVIVLTEDGTSFYNSRPERNVAANVLTQLSFSDNTDVVTTRLGLDRPDELVTKVISDFTGLHIYLAQSQAVVLRPLVETGKFIALVAILILLVSNLFIYLTARQLTKPIRALRDRMEDTKLINLQESFNTAHGNNEIEALNTSFQNLRLRLSDALQREIKAHNLQMEANLDSLQAHVNPHFIYNILNVLSSKSITTGDEEIGEICNGIADMLRYSTATMYRSATIEQELAHVGNYLLLMKKRYEHRLEYSIDVVPEILTQTLPKIVLQQIVENSLNHGYDNLQITMRVRIKGEVRDGWWYIQLSDNGQGFQPGMIAELEKLMQSMHASLLDAQKHQGFRIGGMGLVNTYARLALYTNDVLHFHLENQFEGGARITIGSKMRDDQMLQTFLDEGQVDA